MLAFCRPHSQTSACRVRITRGPLLCILLPVGGIVVYWRGCCARGQRSSKMTGVALLYMTQLKMGRWRYVPDFVSLEIIKASQETGISIVSVRNLILILISITDEFQFVQGCRILLNHGVSPSERDVDGFTAADLAEYNGHYECARYLRSVERDVRMTFFTLVYKVIQANSFC